MTTPPTGQPEPPGQPAPFGQPEPFDPTTMTIQPARPKAGANRMLLPIVGAVALALVAFAGGYLVANATSSQSTGPRPSTGEMAACRSAAPMPRSAPATGARAGSAAEPTAPSTRSRPTR